MTVHVHASLVFGGQLFLLSSIPQVKFTEMEGPIMEELPVMRSMSPSTVFGEPIELDFSQTLIKDPSQTVEMTPNQLSLPTSEAKTKKRKKTEEVST